ncbi:adhesion regulating molecule [Fistulina hepatica ATCC 64428]|uniref:Adhesion regulating molecule n=1 Tax=Fistulina hepatica ATCC 64428 TaxID=1128425 RepID=A0A0D7A1D7_9AGAR|nr:adhesion regulating molecule [Fistulina hepatica ATCC 64428]
MSSTTLLAFKAGRAFRTEGNTVAPSPEKGAIWLVKTDDELLHFQWKSRPSDEVLEDLILFPADASFSLVSGSQRVYVLKFSSSDQRHFFWMQNASTERDEEFVRNVNRLLEDPDFAPFWPNPPPPPNPEAVVDAARLLASPAVNPSTSAPAPGSGVTQEQIQQLSALLASAAASASVSAPDMSLSDILTPANVTALLASHPEVVPALFPHLPPDLPVPPSADVLSRIVNTPQFRSTLSTLDTALRTGLLGNLVRGLGLPEEAGTSIAAFLRGIEEQAAHEREGESREAGDSMDTD